MNCGNQIKNFWYGLVINKHLTKVKINIAFLTCQINLGTQSETVSAVYMKGC